MAENLRGKSTTIILLSLVLNCFLYSYPYTHRLQLPDFMREVAIYSGQQQMQKSELVQVQRISVYEIHSPKWDIYVMPAPANTQERRGRKNLRARSWGRLQKNSQCLLNCWHDLLAALAACTDLHKIKLAHTPEQRP